MKCDHIRTRKQGDTPFFPNMLNNGNVDVCLKEDVDAAIAELKDKCQMHDFFWEGCGFAKRGFKNTIAVSEAFDKLEAENAQLKQKLENVNELIKTARQMLEDAKATHYAESVDAGMRERRLRRALWLARAWRARDIQRWWIAATCAPQTERACSVWNNVERKCRAKAEEYK